MPDPIIIQLIADYGSGDPAFAEVIQRLTFLDRHIHVRATSVPPFSTIATGIWVAQFATVNAFPGLIVYANTAPRKVLHESSDKTDGGRLVYTKLDNGAMIMAVNAGYVLSFVKPAIRRLYLVNVANSGSLFRSRDFYPDAIMAIANEDKRFIGEEINKATIPDPPLSQIGFIDGYGNLKTTIRKSECTLGVGARVKITVNEITKEGIVADASHNVKDGEISWAPGSTGGADRFMEIWLRGGSAWELFGKPRVESDFSVENCPSPR